MEMWEVVTTRPKMCVRSNQSVSTSRSKQVCGGKTVFGSVLHLFMSNHKHAHASSSSKSCNRGQKQLFSNPRKRAPPQGTCERADSPLKLCMSEERKRRAKLHPVRGSQLWASEASEFNYVALDVFSNYKIKITRTKVRIATHTNKKRKDPIKLITQSNNFEFGETKIMEHPVQTCLYVFKFRPIISLLEKV